MTGEDLKQLVTINDLKLFEKNIIGHLKNIVSQASKKELYAPKEFAELTGMKYTTVIHYCKSGKLMAHQDGKGGSWVIYRSEVDRIIEEAKNNIAWTR